MAHGGAAVGRYDGRAIFVPYSIPGEHVRVQITEDKGRFVYARVNQLLKESSHRVQPLCPYFGPGQCGGCHWQHIAYDQQLVYKRSVVIDQLERIGKFENPTVLPTIASPSPWGYRQHTTLTITKEGLPAFWSDDGSHLIPIESCEILHPALVDLLAALDLEALDVKRIRLQIGSDPSDRMIILEIDGFEGPEVEVDLPVSISMLTRDNEPISLIGSTFVKYQVLHRVFRVTAGGFFQANLPVAHILVEEVLRRLALKNDHRVLDLFSGVGLFTAFVAEHAGHVTSVESYPPSVSDADHNLVDLTNIDLIEGSVESVLGDLEEGFDSVVVDPPRSGLTQKVINQLVKLTPSRIVYVSCDPSTFARDAGIFAKAGYHISEVQPVDMFPQTYHIECIATLDRNW
jgi:23S rRNA (uracil1939-C5)-methyltransferase